MKKILTLAIALVMVFAIAAPAFASGWDVDPDPKPEIILFDFDIDALSLTQDATAGWNDGAKAYSILEKTYPVIAGTKVHAVVTVKVPKLDNIDPIVKDLMQRGKVKLKLDFANLTGVTVKAVGTDKWTADITAKDANGMLEVPFMLNTAGYTYTFEIEGYAVESEKDAKIIAYLGGFNEWEGNTFTFDYDGVTYTVVNENNSFKITSESGAVVEFFVKDDGAIDTTKAIEVNGGDKVTKQVDNTLAFVGKDSGKVFSDPTDATYKKLKAQLDEILEVLGFDYEGAKYMRKSHFTKFFGNATEISTRSLTYPAGTIAELVTDDPSVNPPQTGDNASVVGFVMIAVALVAAAAVTVKKVRA